MCTLSWLFGEEGLEVFFSRDEQRQRIKARPPRYYPVADALMPIDPQGGGTWIAVHRRGLVLCLLNHYPDAIEQLSDEAVLSRGLIIPALIDSGDTSSCLTRLRKLRLSRYRPFSLCALHPRGQRAHWQWDGSALREFRPDPPLVSSSVSQPRAHRLRRKLFASLESRLGNTRDRHLHFHTSHLPEPGPYSVCMHHPETATQSLSHIQVGRGIRFHYHDGPPCHASALRCSVSMPPVR